MSKRVVITVRGGAADVVEQPDDVEVVIMDYDIEGSDFESSPSCKIDEAGDYYQEIIFD